MASDGDIFEDVCNQLFGYPDYADMYRRVDEFRDAVIRKMTGKDYRFTVNCAPGGYSEFAFIGPDGEEHWTEGFTPLSARAIIRAAHKALFPEEYQR